MENQDNSISAYVNTLSFSDTGADSGFTEIASRGHSRIVKTLRDGRWVVLKGLKPEKVSDSLCLAMLGKEYAIAMQMNHPNIVQVYSCETNAELGPCIVMQYVDGRTLADFLAENPSKKQRMKVLRELLSAMRYYHSLQIVHRDLKPSNILVTRKGDNVKIIDFGLADTDDYALLKGPAYTLAYAAPEQMQHGKPVDARADIYAFGKILGEVYPKKYRRVARRCTKDNPAQRYQSAEAVEDAMRGTDRMRVFFVALALVAALVAGVIAVFGRIMPPADYDPKEMFAYDDLYEVPYPDWVDSTAKLFPDLQPNKYAGIGTFTDVSFPLTDKTALCVYIFDDIDGKGLYCQALIMNLESGKRIRYGTNPVINDLKNGLLPESDITCVWKYCNDKDEIYKLFVEVVYRCKELMGQ